MTMALGLAAAVLKIGGVIFLFAAALGLMRFKDPLLRMHAATKAGTIGAGLVLAGATLTAADGESVAIGLFAILFLLLTVPIAGHLLGRAAYISGVQLKGLDANDALAGVLQRRAGWVAPAVAAATPPLPRHAPAPSAPAHPARAGAASDLQPLSSVRFVIIASQEKAVAQRAFEIATRSGVPVEAKAVVDSRVLEGADYPDQARAKIKDRLARAVSAVEDQADRNDVKVNLHYAEGDAERLVCNPASSGQLLVLPPMGWCHHGVEVPGGGIREPDGLLRLPGLHGDPVLFVGDRHPGDRPDVLIVEDDPMATRAVIEWITRTAVWTAPQFHLLASDASARIPMLVKSLADAGCHVSITPVVEGDRSGQIMPEGLAAFDAVVLSHLPRPLKTRWYGLPWRDRIAADWKGDVLVVSPAGSTTLE